MSSIKKKQKQQKRRLKKIAKFHTLFSMGIFVFYVGLSLVYSPAFLFSNVRDKFQVLADGTVDIAAKVLGPPVKPIVSGTTICTKGALFVTLVWPADENSTSFDISRDGAPLVSGLALPQYNDSMVTVDKTHKYVVIAHGPMGTGIAVSNPVLVAAPNECAVISPLPAVSVVSISSQNVENSGGLLEMIDSKPEFSGTVNIPNANIHLEVHSEMIISADIQANENGFWSWTPPVNLSLGAHTLFIVATDQLDESRTVSASQDFNIVQEKTTSGNDNSKNFSSRNSLKAKIPPAITSNVPVANKPSGGSVASLPLDFSLKLEKKEIFQGKDLTTAVEITRLDSQYDKAQAVVKYTILDENNKQQGNISESVRLKAGEILDKTINIPTYIPSGRYNLQVEILLGKYDISRVNDFSVLPLPVLNLGGGLTATYPEILSQLGTIAVCLLASLIIWLLLFSREYWLYLHALRHITEENLARLGLFGERKRKGVSH